jgi:hypothetical protein
MSLDRDTTYWEKDWLTADSNMRKRCLVVLSTMYKLEIDKTTIAKEMRAVPIPGKSNKLSIRHDRINEFHGFLKGSKPRETPAKEARVKHQDFGWEFGFALINAASKILQANPNKKTKDRHEDLISLPKGRGPLTGIAEIQELKLMKINRSILKHIGEIYKQYKRMGNVPDHVWTGVALQVYQDMKILVMAVTEECELNPKTFDIDSFLDSFSARVYARKKANTLFYKRPSKK